MPICVPNSAKIAWTKNTLILDRCPNPLQREFYLRATARFGWTRRVLGKPEHVLYDLKYLLPASASDLRL